MRATPVDYIFPEISRGSRTRIAFVDLAKCIALCWVIWEHTEANYMMRIIDNVILPVFWVCSGYTTKYDFSLRSKTKLIAYYFALSFACVIYAVFYRHVTLTADDFWGILYARYCFYDAPASASNPCLLPIYNGVLWFVPSLFTTYCVYKLLLLGKSFRAQALLCILSLVIATFLDMLPILLPWSIDSAFVYAVFMCVGGWLRKYDVMSRASLAMTLAMVVLYLCLDRVTWTTNPSMRDYGLNWPSYILTASVGVTALLMLCRYLEHTWLARVAVWFDVEAIFIFGLQTIFLSWFVEITSGMFESWKVRVALDLAVCFVGGFIVGKIYRLITLVFRR